MKIFPIPKEIVDKIAAGEVIVDPLSVVKELFENSLDAGATKIKLYINKGGKSKIRIIDNGSGFEKEDLKICAKRFTSSKIKTIEDLYNISTLGFRGEALASIASVSELIIESKGWRAEYDENGDLIGDLKPSPITEGTMVEVNNLFVRFPVRRKFMKSDKYETYKIKDLITKYSMVKDNLDVELYVDNELEFKSPPRKLIDKIYYVFGNEVKNNVIEINAREADFEIYGYISKPGYSRKSRDAQVIFVNGRLVKNYNLIKYITEGYVNKLFLERYPVIVIRLKLGASELDVNVHPSKREILFRNDWRLKQLLSSYVSKTLAAKSGIIISSLESKNYSSRHVYPIDKGEQMDFSLLKKDNSIQNEMNSSKTAVDRLYLSENSYNSIGEEGHLSSQNMPPLEILGQINRTYIIAYDNQGMLIIDQHAAHERILYEKFLNEFRNKNIESYELLNPIIIDDQRNIEELFPILKMHGFRLEPYGKNLYILTAVPKVFKNVDKLVIRDIIDAIFDDKNIYEEKLTDKIANKACRSAIKGGEILSKPQMYELIENLAKCRNPYTCPHGRPTILRFSYGDLEHKFKRSD